MQGCMRSVSAVIAVFISVFASVYAPKRQRNDNNPISFAPELLSAETTAGHRTFVAGVTAKMSAGKRQLKSPLSLEKIILTVKIF